MDDQDKGDLEYREDEMRQALAKRKLPTTEDVKPGFYRAIEEIRDKGKE
jgi:hypothetical protein